MLSIFFLLFLWLLFGSFLWRGLRWFSLFRGGAAYKLRMHAAESPRGDGCRDFLAGLSFSLKSVTIPAIQALLGISSGLRRKKPLPLLPTRLRRGRQRARSESGRPANRILA
jgi:hypothetical protein